MDAVALEPVDAVTVTTLVDNVTDMLLADHGPAKRLRWRCPPGRASPRRCWRVAAPPTRCALSTASRA